jgi:hypothetical protein
VADVATVALSGGFALLGVAVGGALEWMRDARTRRAGERERRFGVYSDFAGAIAEYRRAELNRRMRFGAGAEDTAADALVYETRAAARRERYRVEMLTGRSLLASLAAEAIDRVEALKDAADADLKRDRRRSTEAIEAFIEEVARELGPSGRSSG